MVRQIQLIILVACLGIGACGGSSGETPDQPPPPETSRLEQLISALRGMTFQQAVNSTELPEFVDLIVARGEQFVVDERYVDDSTDAIRLGGIRAFRDLEELAGLATSTEAALEQLLGAESNTTVLEEAQSLVIVVYGRRVEGLDIASVEGDATFAKLVNLLVEISETRMVSVERILDSANNNLLFAGVLALLEIETTTGLVDDSTVGDLELLRAPSQLPEIHDNVIAILEAYYPRILFDELGDLPDLLVRGIASRQTNGLYYEDGFYTAEDEAHVLWSGYAAIASLYAGGEQASARAFLDYFLTEWSGSSEFYGFPFAYDTNGNSVLGRPGMEPALLVCFVGLHYTALSNDETYLPMVFGVIDWMETRLLNTSLSLFEQSLLEFSATAQSDGNLFTNDSLMARALFDELGDFLASLGTYPDRQMQMERLGDLVDQGLSTYPWIDNRFILFAQATNGGTTYFPIRYTATGEPIYDSKVFLMALLGRIERPLPGNFDPLEHLADAEALFATDLDIQGFTFVETSSPLVALSVPMTDSTSLLALTYWSLGDYTSWRHYARQLSSLSVDIDDEHALLPHASRPYNGIWNSWPGPESPGVSPTAFFLLMLHRINPFALPEDVTN